jgi:hypothetical protein
LIVKGHKPSPCSVIAMIELQDKSLDFDHKVKCIDYCNEVMNNSPQRSKFEILLTNLVDSITIFTVSRNNRLPYEYKQSELQWDKNIIFDFLYQSKEQFGHSLPLLNVEERVLEINSCLGKGSTSLVYEVNYLDQMAVAKVFEDHENCILEQNVYELIRKINTNNVPLCIPNLIHASANFIITEPVCDVQAEFSSMRYHYY